MSIKLSTMDYLNEAYKKGWRNTDEYGSFAMELSGIAASNNMGLLCEFLDPCVPGAQYSVDCWRLARRVESVEELNRSLERLHRRFPDGKDKFPLVEPDHEIVSFPNNARFMLEIDLYLWGDSEQTIYYFDAVTFREYVRPIANAYLRYNPEKNPIISDMHRHLDYWVQRDFQKSP